MGNVTSRVPVESATFVPSKASSKRLAPRPGSYLWPELRVSRRAVWEGPENDEVDHYLKVCGDQNRRRGTTHVLSEVACTYLLDTEMRRMILEHYTKAQDDLRRATDVYRKVGKGINQFIRESSRSVAEYDAYVLYGERFDGTADHTLPDDTRQMWQKADYTVRGVDGFGRHKLGFSLAGNPALAEERRELIAYLAREEKFDIRHIDTDWEPHAVFFDVRPDLQMGGFIMRGEAAPRDIVLGAPSACTDV